MVFGIHPDTRTIDTGCWTHPFPPYGCIPLHLENTVILSGVPAVVGAKFEATIYASEVPDFHPVTLRYIESPPSVYGALPGFLGEYTPADVSTGNYTNGAPGIGCPTIRPGNRCGRVIDPGEGFFIVRTDTNPSTIVTGPGGGSGNALGPYGIPPGSIWGCVGAAYYYGFRDAGSPSQPLYHYPYNCQYKANHFLLGR